MSETDCTIREDVREDVREKDDRIGRSRFSVRQP
jgi:hypothetical protein